jgi:hypothetical protein
VAAWALVLVLLVPGLTWRNNLVAIWNLVGLADILFVVGTAARLGITAPASMVPLLHLPLAVIPTFLVPLIITSHVLIFRRLRQTAV